MFALINLIDSFSTNSYNNNNFLNPAFLTKVIYMKNIEEIKKILSKNKIQFQNNFKVKEIGIFGSYLKSEQTKKSDLDILVEFESPVDFFDYLELEEHLTNLLGIKVDLVMKKALKPNIGRNILEEVIYV